MQARTSVWSGTPEAIEAWCEHVTRNVKPMVAGLPGNAGVYFFVDRDGRRALTLTLWASEAAAAETDLTADASRAKTVAATGVELVEHGSYELVAQV
jgi:heme-degrading monooxygenase HmoA